uniref:CHK domain-containing protein n=1 Tax=Syphacia muris TaxID=451379 RepID=A0A0N5AR25_9BILA
MIKLFDEFKDHLHDRYATAIAIFFLHSVYESRATDNAEKSAKLLREFASETTFDAENYVANLIIESSKNCTETHLTEGELGTGDVHYLIDFDMAFLGAEPSVYKMHARNIRKEYLHLNDKEYNAQRLKDFYTAHFVPYISLKAIHSLFIVTLIQLLESFQILKLFLQIPNIFATKELRDRYEEQAKQNIANEIKFLST